MHGTFPAKRFALCALVLAAALAARAEPTIAPSPALPTYGQAVAVDFITSLPYFLPATRYTRQGNAFVIDYEYLPDVFGPFPPNLGSMPLNLGELAPGNYSVTARLFDMDHPGGAVSVTTTNLPVMPPTQYGVYSVPAQPHAYDNVGIVVRSAAWFDPAAMHVTVAPSNIRVDFAFDSRMMGTPPAPGMQLYGTAYTGSLPPGSYHLEAWGRPLSGGVSEKYFERDIVVGNAAVVVEYYNEYLDHYFMASGGGEIAALDAGQQGAGWKRTGQSFGAWPSAELAPPQAKAVCRFYAKGPNSHFYTADPAECEQLKQIEAAQRAQAGGGDFLGWAFEGIAFYALLPQDGQCPGGTTPVYRAYNGRALQNDPNHRFMVDSRVRSAMVGWTQEGVAFCTPS